MLPAAARFNQPVNGLVFVADGVLQVMHSKRVSFGPCGTPLEQDRDQTRLRSASGPTAGKSLVAPAGLHKAYFID